MSVSASGQLIDSNQRPLANRTVVVLDMSAPLPRDIATATSGTNGGFQLTYDAGLPQATYGARVLEFRVLDPVYRVLLRFQRDDVVDAALPLGQLEIDAAVAAGWAVTLGAGQTPQKVRPRNAVKFLVDNVEAWQRVASEFKAASRCLELMQLSFELPEDYHLVATDEQPEMVLQFDPAPLSAEPGQQRKVGDAAHHDDRPERLLLDAAKRNPAVDVRLLIYVEQLDSHAIGAGAIILLIPVFGVLIVIAGLVVELAKLIWWGAYHEVKRYFESDPQFQGKNKVLGAKTSPFARTHAKLAVIDATTALGISSPFQQDYFGGPEHAIDDPKRGNKTGVPIHDVSFALAGPAVADIHETYRMHWNVEAGDDNKIDSISEQDAPTLDPTKFDDYATVQVVRTLDGGRFTGPGEPKDGEKGVLEAYLRAIANAQTLIYLENQYFTNDTIGTALLQALTDKSKPDLNVIMMLNIHPDLPLYPRWQNNLIARIRQGMADRGLTEQQQQRFAVFTRWTHEAAPSGKPGAKARIAPNYLHSKVGIVDDKWATLGSANLDGSSLDYTELLHAIAWGDVRNTELNLVLFNGTIDGGIPTTLVDLLRRRLWAEHLGMADAAGQPNPGDQLLAFGNPPAEGWAQLWRSRAADKLQALKDNPAKPDPVKAPAHILPWPTSKSALDSPRAHLAALLGKPKKEIGVDPIKKTRPYSFKNGDWLTKAPELD